MEVVVFEDGTLCGDDDDDDDDDVAFESGEEELKDAFV
jgi:hypothetical protein